MNVQEKNSIVRSNSMLIKLDWRELYGKATFVNYLRYIFREVQMRDRERKRIKAKHPVRFEFMTS